MQGMQDWTDIPDLDARHKTITDGVQPPAVQALLRYQPCSLEVSKKLFMRRHRSKARMSQGTASQRLIEPCPLLL